VKAPDSWPKALRNVVSGLENFQQSAGESEPQKRIDPKRLIRVSESYRQVCDLTDTLVGGREGSHSEMLSSVSSITQPINGPP
jgi:hypothetical protein